MQISIQSAHQNLGIEPAPHLHCKMSTKKIMILVQLSLIPALCVITFFFGFGTLIQFVIAAITAIFCQCLANILRSRPLKRALRDPSGLVTALLLAITLPPLLPWYLTVVATAFAMLIVRECFGGLGMNLFNPAMAGFVFLIVSTPGVFYNTWVTPTPHAYAIANPIRVSNVIFGNEKPEILVAELKQAYKAKDPTNAQALDALTGATFLESIKTERKARTVDNHQPLDFSQGYYLAYVYLAIAYAIGGLFLIFRHVIRYKSPLFFLATIAGCGALWHHLDPSMSINALEHLLMGGTVFGAFYIITDPVTTCGTVKGRILFAIFVGLMAILIRVQGSYSDSIAFAVLLGNCIAPLVDVLTKRRPFGIGYRKGGLQ